jgi:hypothetical protein
MIERLAGVTALSLGGRGPSMAYVFEPHRLALPCWALSKSAAPPLLLTFDRHFDWVPPKVKPSRERDVLSLDCYARLSLDVRNFDHILASAECGLIGDVIAIARAWPLEAWREPHYIDAGGTSHKLLALRSLDELTEGAWNASSDDVVRRFGSLVDSAPAIILDFDLDCFTSPSDVNPTEVLCWPQAMIRGFLQPQCEAFWKPILQKTVCMTVAIEPLHCGGLLAAHELFRDFAQVVFAELLHTDLP